MTHSGRELPVITTLKSMTAIGKSLCQQPTPMYSTQLCIVYRWLYAVKRYFIGLHKNLSLLDLHSFSGVLKWEIRQTQEIV